MIKAIKLADGSEALSAIHLATIVWDNVEKGGSTSVQNDNKILFKHLKPLKYRLGNLWLN
jgi:predicted aspartyl protease